MALANDLFHALHDVVHTLPDSLDLAEVVASRPGHAPRRLRARRRSSCSSPTRRARRGAPSSPRVAPSPSTSRPTTCRRKVREALDRPGVVRVQSTATQTELWNGEFASSGMIVGLRTPDRVVGLVAVEHRAPDRITEQRRGALRPDRVEPRARRRQRPLVRPAAHARCRGRAGPHRPRPARPHRPVARVHRLRARPARRTATATRRCPSCTASCGRSSSSSARRCTSSARRSPRRRDSSRSPSRTSSAGRIAPASVRTFEADTSGSSPAAASGAGAVAHLPRSAHERRATCRCVVRARHLGLLRSQRATARRATTARGWTRRDPTPSVTVSSASANGPTRSEPA